MSEPDIFISYSREDRAHARRFADRLGEAGFKVWWDAALHSGETFDEVIERNLRAAKAVVVLWSPRSVVSRWVRAEATLADRRGCLAPAIIEPCDRPIIFELTHTAELSHWTGDIADAAWQTFLGDLRRLTGVAEPAAPSAPEKPKPAPTAFPKLSVQQAEDDDTDLEQTQFCAISDFDPFERHMLEPEDDGGEGFHVGPAGLKIGRGVKSDVVLADPGVSRQHCEVHMKNGDLLVLDLDSTNGTFVDGDRIEGSAPLPVGSVLQIGSMRLVHNVREYSSDRIRAAG